MQLAQCVLYAPISGFQALPATVKIDFTILLSASGTELLILEKVLSSDLYPKPIFCIR